MHQAVLTQVNRALVVLCLLWINSLSQAAPWINEIVFNPPGSDAPNEYIELRGIPNSIIPDETYLIAVEGDSGGNPGTIQHRFDLSEERIGGNGFLVILQKGHPYAPAFGATVLENTGSGDGFGHGNSSTVRHHGESGDTTLESPSFTFFLIQSDKKPDIGDDIDANDDGTPDSEDYSNWIILDSIGMTDGSGAGDFAYGALNFRRGDSPGNGAGALGTVLSIIFTPDYLARADNSTGYAFGDWIVSQDLDGDPPNTALGGNSETIPQSFADGQLNHVGSANFGAPAIPGVIIDETDDSTVLLEGGSSDSFTISLSTTPSGTVTIELVAEPEIEISTDSGSTYGAVRSVNLSSTSLQTVHVRAPENNLIDLNPYERAITPTVTSTTDSARYPVGTLIPEIKVLTTDNDLVLLNELKVNPPGPDNPFEFIELTGTPSAVLTNIYFLGVEGDEDDDPGVVSPVIDLTSAVMGENGLLIITATGHPYSIPSGTGQLEAPQLADDGGALRNGSASFLLVASPESITEGEDLDDGDNGILEGLDNDAIIVDAVGWLDSGTNDVLFGGVGLTQALGTPDAAARFPANITPLSEDAWFSGDLLGINGDTLLYDETSVGPDFPFGTVVTPGVANNTAPVISPIAPLSGVIGDPTNPEVIFLVSDEETDPDNLVLSASSSDQTVVSDPNLIVTPIGDGVNRLTVIPNGVGFATITITANDGNMIWTTSFSYAASEGGGGSSRWHTEVADASAALPIDDSLMFVADDENQSIRIYNRRLSGLPISRFNFNTNLFLTDFEDNRPREVDVEGATRVGNRIFWIGSHSHANNSEVRTNRSHVFATDVSGSGLTTQLSFAGFYKYFKHDLVDWDVNNVHGKGANYYGLAASAEDGTFPKAPSGFNIEGLSMAPGSSTTAYVAFRAPIVPASTRTYAFIVPVLNFTTMAISEGPPGTTQFGDPIELDLFGRGIRSIEGTANGYIIVGGASGDNAFPYPNDFKLYTWTGNPNDQPVQRNADLTGLNPEAIVELPPLPWNATSTIQLLSDNGRTIYYNTNIIAKKLPEPNFRKFRSDLVNLGEATVPAPIITSIVESESNVTLTWRALEGALYRVQYATDLLAPVWINLPGDVISPGPYATKSDIPPAATQRYYRIISL